MNLELNSDLNDKEVGCRGLGQRSLHRKIIKTREIRLKKIDLLSVIKVNEKA